MIRPLEYCQSVAHLEGSIETIDVRIHEMQELRKQYVHKIAAIHDQGKPLKIRNDAREIEHNECYTEALLTDEQR